MSRKIIGVTVGTTLPKPNFEQTDPTKGDYIRNKPDFEGLQNEVSAVSALVGDKSVAEQISEAMSGSMEIEDIVTIDLDGAVEGSPNTINADTLGGKAASEFALATDVENLREMIGSGGSISTQINSAIDDLRQEILGGEW